MQIHKTIFIRHANRRHISVPSDFSEGGLTIEGKINAFKAGRFLKGRFSEDIQEIHTSRRKRCRETAMLISLGYSPIKRVPLISELKEPDTLCAGFVKNVDEWNHLCMNSDFFSMFFMQTETLFKRYSKFNLFKYNSPSDYADEVLQKYLVEKSIIAVTHDFTIAPLWVALSNKLGFCLEGIGGRPGYLTGIVIYHAQGKILKIESINAIAKNVSTVFSAQN
ncbi:MAG: phosphoglycerate mutase family protein [Candidatus Micrarchaeia archaeon]